MCKALGSVPNTGNIKEQKRKDEAQEATFAEIVRRRVCYRRGENSVSPKENSQGV